MLRKWEYMELDLRSHPATLAKVGKQGWELVCCYPGSRIGIFKRPLRRLRRKNAA